MESTIEKEQDIKPLLDGLKEKEFSEDVHAIGFVAYAGEKYSITGDYEIPESYNIDTIVIMPVNTERVHVYWEITDKLLQDKLKGSESPGFTVKVYEVNLGATKKEKEVEVYSFNTKDKIGSEYIDFSSSLKPLVAKIGVTANGKFNELLESKPISIPSFQVLGLDDSLWTNRLMELPEEDLVKRKDLTKVEEAADKEADTESKVMGTIEMEILNNIVSGRITETGVLNILMEMIEKLRGFSGNEVKVMKLMKGFLDVRSKDVELLRLFLDLLEQLKFLEGGKGEVLKKYFEELKSITEQVGSSDTLLKK